MALGKNIDLSGNRCRVFFPLMAIELKYQLSVLTSRCGPGCAIDHCLLPAIVPYCWPRALSHSRLVGLVFRMRTGKEFRRVILMTIDDPLCCGRRRAWL